ncbi:MAG: ion channel [Methanobacterium sp.]|nr:ion channel [Methanobacterium sp.]
MQRNFKVIFNVFLFIFIFIDVVFLIFITLDFALSLRPSMLEFIRYDLIVSILIILHVLLRMNREKNRRQYLIKNWIDIFAVVPVAFIVILLSSEPALIIVALFLIRIYALIRYLLKIRSIIRFTEKTKLDIATFLLLGTFIFGSLIFFWVESPVNPQVTNLDSAAFFMIVSMSTTGYGNIVPYTSIGTLVSAIAIIIGIGYTGWVTAAIASSLIEELRKERKEEIKKQNAAMKNIIEKLDKIEKELEEIKNSKG